MMDIDYSESESDFDAVEGFTSGEPEVNYNILSESDIRRRQEEEINHTSAMLCLRDSESRLLLCNYKWNVEKLHEEWFTDESAVRQKVGLLDNYNNNVNNSSTKHAKSTCEICFEDGVTLSVSCDHEYCVICWKQYISAAINDSGSGTLMLRCPGYKCGAAVTRDLVKDLCSEEDVAKYDRYFFRSYVESKMEKVIKWCPAPGCEYAVEFMGDDCRFGYDVTCECSYSFCWNCVEPLHRPADCEVVEKWLKKNNSEAENTKWILAFSKPCPKCKRPIEKNKGCNHMTCRAPCWFQFCWLCRGDWYEHSRGGGSCNGYDTKIEDQDETMRKHAKHSLQRYSHYFERWASNNKSQQKAMEDLRKVQTVDLKILSSNVTIPESQLAFLEEGWQQIIECRRVLKWTYAYGYYLEEREPGKRQFFEYLQGQAENCLEKLHACAELELSPFLQEGPNQDPDLNFIQYRCKMVGLTKMTGKHFEKLSKALENGLQEVVVPEGATTSTMIQETKKRNNNNNNNNSISSSQLTVFRVPLVPLRRTRHPVRHNSHAELDDDFWQCDRCTFVNSARNIACQMCANQ